MKLRTVVMTIAAYLSLSACSTVENWWHGTENEETRARSSWESETRGRYQRESDLELDESSEREQREERESSQWPSTGETSGTTTSYPDTHRSIGSTQGTRSGSSAGGPVTP